MLIQKAGAATSPEALAPRKHQTKFYNQPVHMSMKLERERQIAERRAHMPKQYRSVYDRAMTGRSRKAAMRAFCVACCGYEIREVFICSDLACPLWPYRPLSRISQGAREGLRERAESPKPATGSLW